MTSDSLSPLLLKELFEQDEPGNRVWFKDVVEAYVETTEALNLNSLPWDEKILLERLLVDVVEAWIDRESIGPSDEPRYGEVLDLISVISRCAFYFTRNTYLETELTTRQLRSRNSEQAKIADRYVDYRDPTHADFKIQPRYPRLSWGGIPPSEIPILYESYCGAQADGLIYFLKSQKLEASYVKYVELLNILRSKSSHYAQKSVLKNVRKKTNFFSGNRAETKENLEAELTLFSRIIRGPSLLNVAVHQGNWSFIFTNLRRVTLRVLPMIAASICVSLGFFGTAVFFTLWFIGSLIAPTDPALNRLDPTLIVYNDFMNNFHHSNGRVAWYPRSFFELEQIIKRLVDSGEKMPIDIELLIKDLQGDEHIFNSHFEHVGECFDGSSLRFSLLNKLLNNSSLATEFNARYISYAPKTYD